MLFNEHFVRMSIAHDATDNVKFVLHVAMEHFYVHQTVEVLDRKRQREKAHCSDAKGKRPFRLIFWNRNA